MPITPTILVTYSDIFPGQEKESIQELTKDMPLDEVLSFCALINKIHFTKNFLNFESELVKEIVMSYEAELRDSVLKNLKLLNEKWSKKYSLALKILDNNWTNIATFFKYPEEIRTLIYTTNAVEALHRQFRKVTKPKSLFPNDDALKKMLYLAYKDISKKWTMPVRNWAFIISQFSVLFKEKIAKFL